MNRLPGSFYITDRAFAGLFDQVFIVFAIRIWRERELIEKIDQEAFRLSFIPGNLIQHEAVALLRIKDIKDFTSNICFIFKYNIEIYS